MRLCESVIVKRRSLSLHRVCGRNGDQVSWQQTVPPGHDSCKIGRCRPDSSTKLTVTRTHTHTADQCHQESARAAENREKQLSKSGSAAHPQQEGASLPPPPDRYGTPVTSSFMSASVTVPATARVTFQRPPSPVLPPRSCPSLPRGAGSRHLTWSRVIVTATPRAAAVFKQPRWRGRALAPSGDARPPSCCSNDCGEG